MEPTALLPFAAWESFYVIVGSSAAALTGLQFVVIFLGAEVGLGSAPGIHNAWDSVTYIAIERRKPEDAAERDQEPRRGKPSRHLRNTVG